MHASLLLIALLPAADWDRFRGPNGTGTSDDKNVPVEWKADNVLWKTPVGSGHSSPIVSAGKLFLVSATPKERSLVCVDAASGKLLWKKGVPGGKGRTHVKSSLASATPCSDGTRVFAVYWDGEAVSLHAYRHDGEALWSRPLGDFKSQHGPGFSPIVVAGKVIVNDDQDGKADLLAFDAETGKPAWAVKRKAHRACYSTPILLDDGTMAVTSTTAVTGYDPATGKERWSFTWPFPKKPLRTVGSSVVSNGMLICCSGDGDGSRDMIAVKLGGEGELPATAKVWQSSTPRKTPYVPTVLAKGDHLYTVNDTGFAVCRDARTGEEAWQHRLAAEVSASPVLIDGKVFVFDERGEVTVFEASPGKARVLARNKVGEAVLSSPAVSGGRLYVRGETHLFCIGKPGK